MMSCQGSTKQERRKRKRKEERRKIKSQGEKLVVFRGERRGRKKPLPFPSSPNQRNQQRTERLREICAFVAKISKSWHAAAQRERKCTFRGVNGAGGECGKVASLREERERERGMFGSRDMSNTCSLLICISVHRSFSWICEWSSKSRRLCTRYPSRIAHLSDRGEVRARCEQRERESVCVCVCVRNAKQRNGTADLIGPLQPASWPIPTNTAGTTPARAFRAEWSRDKLAGPLPLRHDAIPTRTRANQSQISRRACYLQPNHRVSSSPIRISMWLWISVWNSDIWICMERERERVFVLQSLGRKAPPPHRLVDLFVVKRLKF